MFWFLHDRTPDPKSPDPETPHVTFQPSDDNIDSTVKPR